MISVEVLIGLKSIATPFREQGTVENDAINFKILLLTENAVITKFIEKEYVFGKIFKIHNSYSL